MRNNGPLASDGAQIIDALPAGVSFVSASGCVNDGGTVRCAVGPLAVHASRVFTLTVHLSTPFTGARPLVNTATVDAPGDTVPGNNTSSASAPVGNDAGGPEAIPTLSDWALIVLAGLLAWCAAKALARSRRSA